MHPAGKNFEAEVINHGMNQAKTGSDQIVIGFKTEHGEITGFFSLAGGAAEYSIKKLREAGFKGDSLEELNDEPGFRGAKCFISVDHEKTPDGKEVAKVGWVNATPGGSVKTDPAVAKSAAKRFDALLKANPPKSDGEAPWDR
jgi:hypothetical protein